MYKICSKDKLHLHLCDVFMYHNWMYWKSTGFLPIHFHMQKSSLDILLNFSICAPQKKKKSLEQRKGN